MAGIHNVNGSVKMTGHIPVKIWIPSRSRASVKLHSNITNGRYGNCSPLNVQALDMISLSELITMFLVDVLYFFPPRTATLFISIIVFCGVKTHWRCVLRWTARKQMWVSHEKTHLLVLSCAGV